MSDIDEKSRRPELEWDTGLTEFYSSEAKSMIAQHKNIEHLLGQTHDYTAPGTHCEVLLRDFLRRNLPFGIAVDKGFIHGRIKDGEKSRHSPEIDILIHDNLRYRPIFRLEEFAIVQPEAVLGVIQVKRSLGPKLKGGLENVANAMRHLVDSAIATHKTDLTFAGMAASYCGERRVFSALVGFDHLPAEYDRLRKHIESVHSETKTGLTNYSIEFRVWMLPQFVGSLQGCFGANFFNRQRAYQKQIDFYGSNFGEGENTINVALQALLWLLTQTVWSNRGVKIDSTNPPRFAFPPGMKTLGTLDMFR